jgi:hypothetical protein
VFHDSPVTRIFQEASMEGFAIGFAIGFEKGYKETHAILRQNALRTCLAKSMSVKEIAELLDVPVNEVRRLAHGTAK